MTIDRYVRAATRDNTRRSYRSAVEHFEVTWGGFLPATADSVARYLADHAERLSAATLKQPTIMVELSSKAMRWKSSLRLHLWSGCFYVTWFRMRFATHALTLK